MKLFRNIILIAIFFTYHITSYAQYQYVYSDDSGGSGLGGGIILMILLGFLIVYGGNEARTTILNIALFFGGLFIYAWLLMKLGKVVQEAIRPTKDQSGIGIISIILFCIGWFVPLYFYHKKNTKD